MSFVVRCWLWFLLILILQSWSYRKRSHVFHSSLLAAAVFSDSYDVDVKFVGYDVVSWYVFCAYHERCWPSFLTARIHLNYCVTPWRSPTSVHFKVVYKILIIYVYCHCSFSNFCWFNVLIVINSCLYIHVILFWLLLKCM